MINFIGCIVGMDFSHITRIILAPSLAEIKWTKMLNADQQLCGIVHLYLDPFLRYQGLKIIQVKYKHNTS